MSDLETGDRMTFGQALRLLKLGKSVSRANWNGKNMRVYLVGANSYASQTDVAKAIFGDTVPYRAYLAMVTAQGDVVPWVASQSDLLENDWVEV